eukprot:2783294-Heterocapsa_arctica.AAC.1
MMFNSTRSRLRRQVTGVNNFAIAEIDSLVGEQQVSERTRMGKLAMRRGSMHLVGLATVDHQPNVAVLLGHEEAAHVAPDLLPPGDQAHVVQ